MCDLEEQYKNICSSETIYSRRKGFFFELCDTIRQSVSSAYIQNVFSNVYLDEDRILKMFVDPRINVIVLNMLSKIFLIYKKKDAYKSKRKRIEFLRDEKDKDLSTILHQLNEAVLQAPEIGEFPFIDDGYTLPLAIITRADALLKYSEYFLALEDFKNVIVMNTPFINKTKISQNILLCQSRISQMTLHDFKSDKYEIIQGLYRNEHHLPISNLLKIQRTTSVGKQAVANYIIHPGDSLIAEGPIASCLLPDFYKTHCQTCLRRFKICYGCPNCSAIGFCSYKCRDDGLRSFHKYECKISSLLIGSGISILSHLALRIITQLGLEKCLAIYNGITQGKAQMELQDYLKIYQLESHSSERPAADFFERSLITAFLIQCLKQVNFFDLKDDTNMTVTKEHLYVGTLLLKNLQLLQFNAHEIYESICNGKHKIDPLYVGVGIYPNAARLNHGCYSATIRYFCGKSIILRSSRLLQEDDVVAENYGPVFFKKTLLERQRYLAGRYWFKCCCEACSDNWPLMNELSYIRIRIRCCSENCTKYLNVQFHNDYNKVYFCEKCRTSHKFSPKYQNIIKRCILWYAYGITIMDKHCIPEATQILLTALKVFHHIACAPHRFTHLAELGLQYCLMNNRR